MFGGSKRGTGKKFSWTCPACQAVNDDPTGLCKGCEARIDPAYIARQRAAAAGIDLDESGYYRLPGRPRLVLVAVGLLVLNFLLSLSWTLGGGYSGFDLFSQGTDTLFIGVMTAFYAYGFLNGIAWARTFYLALTALSVPGLFLAASAQNAAAFSLVNIVLFVASVLPAIVVAVILIMPSVSDWFRRSTTYW